MTNSDLIKQQERHFQQWCPRCRRTTVHSELCVLQPGGKVYTSIICLNCNRCVADSDDPIRVPEGIKQP